VFRRGKLIVIGRGGYGVTHRARHTKNERPSGGRKKKKTSMSESTRSEVRPTSRRRARRGRASSGSRAEKKKIKTRRNHLRLADEKQGERDPTSRRARGASRSPHRPLRLDVHRIGIGTLRIGGPNPVFSGFVRQIRSSQDLFQGL